MSRNLQHPIQPTPNVCLKTTIAYASATTTLTPLLESGGGLGDEQTLFYYLAVSS